MSKYEHEFVHMMDGVEKQIDSLENPHHRKILKNYRRHALLEVSGRYQEILSPDMTVEEPVYRLFENGQSIVLDGMQQVEAFYQALAETDTLVMWTGDSKFSVSDHGFSGETLFSQFVPGRILGDGVFGAVHAGEASADKDSAGTIDPDGWYLVRRTLAFVWPYDETGRLVGEHVYEDSASKVVTRVDPSEVISAERAAELLAPLLEKYLP
ncbi:hypothetical protein ABIC73_004127 [Prescottella equi]|nr:hypothetical protein [Prescottella equi]MBU4614888.1 hypothetical protein [Rhodococcus sp. GG48]NKS29957.1 hypothetical protein [Prescottella equi]NKS36836.1 hypothetical protein [Prescottella equi]